MVQNMVHGKPLNLIIKFAIPLLIGNIFQQLYNTADSLIVGNKLGDTALAAVSSTGMLIFLLIGFFQGIGMGAGVVVAHHIGALEYKKVSRVVHSAVSIALVLGTITAIIGFVFSRKFLSWMGVVDSAEFNTLTQATLYLRIIFLGVPASFLYNYLRYYTPK